MISQAAEGYTLVLCAAHPCHAAQRTRTFEALRECVRTSRHGVMVVAGCTLGPASCRLRPPGPVLVVQPCDADRVPTEPALRIGPLRTDDDVAAVREWIRAARFDSHLLPPHLVALHRGTRGAAGVGRAR